MKKTAHILRLFFAGLLIAHLIPTVFGDAVWGQNDSLLQRFEMPSAPHPVGSGARALGMGGAFISIADDATSASWNPAGLTQLKDPEISIVGAFTHRTEDNTFGKNPEADGTQSADDSRLNFLSMTYPFKIKEKAMSVSLSYQNLYEFNREWDYCVSDRDYNATRHYSLDGSLSAFGISYCIDVMEKYSFGVTLNLWEDGFNKNEWEEIRIEQRNLQDGDIFDSYTRNHYAFSGCNVTLGFLWSVWQYGEKWIRIGAVFKSPFSADLEWEYDYRSISRDGTSVSSEPGSESESLEMPMTYGIGVSCRFSDQFTAALDLYRTEWGDYILTNSFGDEYSPITGEPAGESETEPTCHVRLGMEYLFLTDPGKDKSEQFALLGGLFYDPAPAEGSPDDFYGFSLGAGFGIDPLRLNLAYQFRFGNDVGDSILKDRRFSQDIKEHILYSSAICYF